MGRPGHYVQGVNWGEPERAPRGHDVYYLRACVRAYVRSTYLRAHVRVRTYVSARPAWERVKSVWTWLGMGTSAVWDLMGGWERAQRDKNAWHSTAQRAAIVTKKRFVLEKFLPLHASYERKVCAWTAVGYGCGPWASSTCYSKLTHKGHVIG